MNRKPSVIMFGGDSVIRFWPSFISIKESKHLFTELITNYNFTQSNVIVYGNSYKTPRHQAWMSDPGVKASLYTKEKAIPWCESVLKLKLTLELLLDTTFDYCLLNLYKTGEDYISYHSDDEASLGKDVIASISLGASRRFLFRKKDDPKKIHEFFLESGSLIVMSGEDTQKHWQHSVPKMKRVKEPRLNLTFRKS